MSESLQEIINRLWTAPENAEWTPKTDVVPLSDVQAWMSSSDIEVLGFTHALMSDRRFRIEPPIPLEDYVRFTKHYFGRCLKENPDGEWSDSRHSAGTDLVNIFAGLWRDASVPRSVLKDLKAWLENIYREGDGDLRQCLIQALLEHLFEQEGIREFFSDWRQDALLADAYENACEWYRGGGRTPLRRPPFTEY